MRLCIEGRHQTFCILPTRPSSPPWKGEFLASRSKNPKPDSCNNGMAHNLPLDPSGRNIPAACLARAVQIAQLPFPQQRTKGLPNTLHIEDCMSKAKVKLLILKPMRFLCTLAGCLGEIAGASQKMQPALPRIVCHGWSRHDPRGYTTIKQTDLISWFDRLLKSLRHSCRCWTGQIRQLVCWLRCPVPWQLILNIPQISFSSATSSKLHATINQYSAYMSIATFRHQRWTYLLRNACCHHARHFHQYTVLCWKGIEVI